MAVCILCQRKPFPFILACSRDTQVTQLAWNSLNIAERTFIGVLNSQFSNLDTKYRNVFPNLASARTLLIASDYSGESHDSNFNVSSFLITSLESWAKWEPERIQVRQDFLSDSRRMSFKRLTDKRRQRALCPLLDAASELEGLSLSVAVDKRCDALFNSPPLELSNPDFDAYQSWKPKVLDKAFFVVHMLALLLAGLGAPMQNVLWFTDEDSIAANDKRIGELTQLFAWISSIYLPFTLGHMRCGTAQSDDGSRQIEDYIAIPDLVAGALSEQLNLRTPLNNDAGDIFWLYRPDMSNKTKSITSWFSDASCSLKRLFCVIEPHSDRIGHKISCHHFYNQLS